ncbi:hypothetical protein CXF76_10720 [Pseudoalteromonas sp. 78C3]|nr:hypothetical protein CXF76_10720 [Pseudoalteromonas sp. 78C3]
MSKLHAYNISNFCTKLVDAQLAGVTSKTRNFYARCLLFCFSLCNKILSDLFTKRLRGRFALEKPISK